MVILTTRCGDYRAREEERHMDLIKDISWRFRIAGELITFLWEMKRWWMIPMVVVLMMFGIMLIVGQSTVIGPFIYTLF